VQLDSTADAPKHVHRRQRDASHAIALERSTRHVNHQAMQKIVLQASAGKTIGADYLGSTTHSSRQRECIAKNKRFMARKRIL
jgi:hypothetical protein